jgi:hypothetical protein
MGEEGATLTSFVVAIWTSVIIGYFARYVSRQNSIWICTFPWDSILRTKLLWIYTVVGRWVSSIFPRLSIIGRSWQTDTVRILALAFS